MRNFLWTGDPANKKRITKAWHKICCPKDEGGCCATDKRLQDRGINIASRCSLCLKNIEDDTHLFWICPFAANIWSWIHELFGFQWNSHVQNFETVTDHATTRSAAIRDIWVAAITNVLIEIWHHRNSCIFNNIPASSRRVKSKVLANFYECSILMKSIMHNRVEDLMIFKNLQINPRPAKPIRVLQCFWSLPDLDQLKIGCDGCSRGNPGPSGAGVILRDHTAGPQIEDGQKFGSLPILKLLSNVSQMTEFCGSLTLDGTISENT
ncbi:Reverse transcriptase zinc-binding domain [Macleaya cordata]|uniref:Reverse transcriptase zinc-binding domain n=1 Tax=Macleaya cordata TaxID=56857 RepID=A0A200QC63_MACCD|nr:Reverse transcriptase zinc-binding domain [Macleaya cordata]